MSKLAIWKMLVKVIYFIDIFVQLQLGTVYFDLHLNFL